MLTNRVPWSKPTASVNRFRAARSGEAGKSRSRIGTTFDIAIVRTFRLQTDI
jgi:hypothetical protein